MPTLSHHACKQLLKRDLGLALQEVTIPWIVLGDWNALPSELLDNGWAQRLGACVRAPQVPTCTSGHGNTIDYLLLSPGLATRLDSVSSVLEGPTKPHHHGLPQRRPCSRHMLPACVRAAVPIEAAHRMRKGATGVGVDLANREREKIPIGECLP